MIFDSILHPILIQLRILYLSGIGFIYFDHEEKIFKSAKYLWPIFETLTRLIWICYSIFTIVFGTYILKFREQRLILQAMNLLTTVMIPGGMIVYSPYLFNRDQLLALWNFMLKFEENKNGKMKFK
jgi:hypothetical protein